MRRVLRRRRSIILTGLGRHLSMALRLRSRGKHNRRSGWSRALLDSNRLSSMTTMMILKGLSRAVVMAVVGAQILPAAEVPQADIDLVAGMREHILLRGGRVEIGTSIKEQHRQQLVRKSGLRRCSWMMMTMMKSCTRPCQSTSVLDNNAAAEIGRAHV